MYFPAFEHFPIFISMTWGCYRPKHVGLKSLCMMGINPCKSPEQPVHEKLNPPLDPHYTTINRYR